MKQAVQGIGFAVAMGVMLFGHCSTAQGQTAPAPDRPALPTGPLVATTPAPIARQALQSRAIRQVSLVDELNANTVSIISGTSGATYFRIASDLAFILDDGDKLRILPILGKGAEQNGYDLLFLKGVDLGLVRTDTLEQLKLDKRIVNPAGQLVYIARLFNDEMHVIAASDVTDLRQLANKKVTFDVRGSGSNFTGRAIFQALEIPVEAINVDQPSALEMLKRGDVSAVVSVAAKPVGIVSGFKGNERFHLVPVPYPASVAERYFPASISDADYPDLVAKGETVNTIAVGTILGAYNWPERSARYKRLARFVDAFFSKFDEFLKAPRHPKWQEVNLSATVQGWTRFRAAREWLERARGPAPAASSEESTRQFALFQKFLAAKNILPAAAANPADQERLFKEFLEWNRTRNQ